MKASKPSPSRAARRLRWVRTVLLSLIALLVVALMVLPPVFLRPIVRGPIIHSNFYRPEDFDVQAEQLSLTTSDGLILNAFEATVPDPRAVVIFLSGIHNPSVTAFWGHSAWLAQEGFASVLLELRAHGESEGDLIALGYHEVRDVEACIKYLKAQPGYADIPIVLWGVSMGGVTAINAGGTFSDVAGVISISAYSSWDGVFFDNMVRSGAPRWFSQVQRPFMRAYTALRFGLANRHLTPLRQIQQLADRPVLLIHSEGDSQVPYSSLERLVAVAPDSVEVWSREGDWHLGVQGDFLAPQLDAAYAARIGDFLDKHFPPASENQSN